MTTTKEPTEGQAAMAGCIVALLIFALWLAVLTPLIMIAWNVGLYGADIAGNEISWTTALGLAILVSVLRTIVAAGRMARA